MTFCQFCTIISRFMDSLESGIGELNDALEEAQKPIIERLQMLLAEAEGKKFGTFEEKKRIVAMIQQMANQLKVAFRCVVCGEPARLRCAKARSSDEIGYIGFLHARTSHGGSQTFPHLELIDQPLDRRKTVLSKDSDTEE